MEKYIYIQYNELIDELFTGLGRAESEKLLEFADEFESEDELLFKTMFLIEQANLLSESTIKNALFGKISDLRDTISNYIAARENFDKSDDGNLIQDEWLINRKPREIVFRCENVCKKYPGSEFELKDVSLCLKAGEITGVVGENGNGKTTLLKIIAGNLFHDKGKGTLSYETLEGNGKIIDWPKIKSQVAYLPQELGKLVGSVKNSIRYSAALHKIKGEQNDKEVEYIIQRLGLAKYKNAIWEDLSGGFKLRFALATTLVWKPKILVLDEPLANLDINTQIRVLNDLKDLSKSIKNPMAVILSSQNIEEVEDAADNMVVLKNGKLIFNNQTIRIGEDRAENMFQFKCEHSLEEIKEYFSNMNYTGIDTNGFSYFITTPKDISEIDFLQYCGEMKISISYFQDISISSKRLIINTGLS